MAAHSQFFATSMAFAQGIGARLPLCLHMADRLTTRQISLDAADCRFARPPYEDFVSGHRRRHFGRPDLRLDFVATQLLGGWTLTETGLSPARRTQLS